MFRIALRDTRFHVVRFAMSILAVALATAFVAATFSFTNMLGQSIAQISESTSTADLYVRGPQVSTDDAFAEPQRDPVEISLVEDISTVPGVAAASPSLGGQAVLVDPDGELVSNGAAPTIAAVLEEGIDDFQLIAGHMPAARGEIALEARTFEISGYQIGDTAPLTIGDSPTIEATIVGEVDSGWTTMGATFVFVTRADAIDAFAPTDVVPSIAVALEDGADADEVAATITALADDLEVVTGEQVREEARSATAEAMGFIETFMLVFAFIALFVGTFLIGNTFAMLVRQRQREFALLRAVGASPGQVVGSLLVQALVIGAIGALVGLGAGVLLVVAAQQIFAALGTPFEGNAWLPLDRAALVALAAVLFTAFAAVAPSRQAALTPPVEAMRPDERPETSAAWRDIVALIAFIAGAVLLWRALATASALQLGIAAALLLSAMLAIGPRIVPPLVGTLALPWQRLRPIGMLARGNMLRSPRRTAATAAALTIGMTFVAAAAVLADSATASTRSIIDNQMTADFFVGGTRGMTPAAVGDELQSVDSVTEITPVQFGLLQSQDPAGTLTISSMDSRGYEEMLTVPITEGSIPAAADEIVVSQRLRDEFDIRPGATLTFAVPGSEDVVSRVVGVTNDTFMGTDLYALTEGYERLVPEPTRSVLFYFVNVDGDLEAARADIAAALENQPMVQVLDRDELAELGAATISMMMTILYALLGLALVIAVLSIINTLAMAVMERTREIGLMRAVGLSGGQLVGMIMIESVLTALFGSVMGIALGVGLGATLPLILSDLGLTTLAIPWGSLGVILAGTILVGVVAAVWPAWRALRQPILLAIAVE